MGKIHNLTLKKVYCFPRAPNLLIRPHKWDQDRVEEKVGREGTYLKVMGKRSILVLNNGKLQRIILHAPGYALPETSINQGQEGLTKFYSMFAEFFKESDMVHTSPSVVTTQ